MISATLTQRSSGFTACRLEGHSGYSEEGSDIVCAAVSVLGCTCVNALESVCGIQAEILKNENGLLSFRLPELTTGQNEKAQILMGALKQGLSDLAEGYPQFVQLRITERRK